MATITTTNFSVEISGYISGGVCYLYSGQHNYLKATRVGGTDDTISVKVGGYDTFSYQLTEAHTADIDITSAIKTLTATSSTIVIDDTTQSIAVIEGISPTAYKSMVDMLDQCYANSGAYGLYNQYIVPETIIKGGGALALPCGYDFNGYNVFTGFNLASNLMTIASTATILRATLTTQVEGWVRRLKKSDNPIVKVECKCALGRPYASGMTLTANEAVFYLEKLSGKIDTTVTDLQTIGDGYKAINEFTEQITIGLRGCTAYDYAYYSLLLLTANDIKIEGEPCELVTKSATIPVGSKDKYNLEITLKRRNYVTI